MVNQYSAYKLNNSELLSFCLSVFNLLNQIIPREREKLGDPLAGGLHASSIGAAASSLVERRRETLTGGLGMWQCPGQLLVSEESLKLQKKFVSLGLAESLQQQQQRHASSQYLSVFLGQGESVDGKQSVCMVDAQENAAQVIPGFLGEDEMPSARKRSEQAGEGISKGKEGREQLEVIDEMKIKENKADPAAAVIGIVVSDKDKSEDTLQDYQENKQPVKIRNLQQIERIKDKNNNNNNNSETQSIDENVFEVEQVYSFSNHTMSSMPTKVSVPELAGNNNNNNPNSNISNVRSRTLPINSFRATSATFALGSSNETLVYSATQKSFQNYSNPFIPSQNVFEKGFNTDESSNLCYATLTHNTINFNNNNTSSSSQNQMLLRGQQPRGNSIVSANAYASSNHNNNTNNNTNSLSNNVWTANNTTTTGIYPQSPGSKDAADSEANQTQGISKQQSVSQQHQQTAAAVVMTPPAKKLLYHHEQQPLSFQSLRNNSNHGSSNNNTSSYGNDNNNNNSEAILHNHSNSFNVPNISINGSSQQFNDQTLNFMRIQQQLDCSSLTKDNENISRAAVGENTTVEPIKREGIDPSNDIEDDNERNVATKNYSNDKNAGNIQCQSDGVYSFFYSKSGVEGDNEPPAALDEEAVDEDKEEKELGVNSQTKGQLQLPCQQYQQYQAQNIFKQAQREVESECSSCSSHSSSFSSSSLSEEDEDDQENAEITQQQQQQQQQTQQQQNYQPEISSLPPTTTEQFSDFGSCRGKATTGHFLNSRSQNQMSSPQQRSLASSRSRAQTGFFGAAVAAAANTQDYMQSQLTQQMQGYEYSNPVAHLKSKLQQYQSKQMTLFGRASNVNSGMFAEIASNDGRSYRAGQSVAAGKLSDLGKETKSIEGSKDDVWEKELKQKKKYKKKKDKRKGSSNDNKVKRLNVKKVCNSSSVVQSQQLDSRNNVNKEDDDDEDDDDGDSISPSANVIQNGMSNKMDRVAVVVDGSSNITIDNNHHHQSRNNASNANRSDRYNYNKDKSTANGNSNNNLSSVSNHTNSNNNNNNNPNMNEQQRRRQSLSGSQAVFALASHKTHQIFKSIVMLFQDSKSDESNSKQQDGKAKNSKDQKENHNNNKNNNTLSKVISNKNTASIYQSPALKGITIAPLKDSNTHNTILAATNTINSRTNLAMVSNTNNNYNSAMTNASQFQRDMGLLDLCEKCRNVNSESRNLSIAHPSEQDLYRKHLPEMNSNHNINYMTNPSKLTNSPSGWYKTAKDSHNGNFISNINNNSSTPSDQFKDMPKLVQSISSQTNKQIQQWQMQQQFAQYQGSQLQYPLSWRSDEDGEAHAMLNTHSNGCRCSFGGNINNNNPVKSIYNTLANHSPNIYPQNHNHHNNPHGSSPSTCHHHHHSHHHHHHNTNNIQQDSNINFIGNHNNISNNIIINNSEPMFSLTQITSCNHLNSQQNIPNERNTIISKPSSLQQQQYDQSGMLFQQIPISTSNQGLSQLHQFLNSDRSSAPPTHHMQKLSWQNSPYNINVSSPKEGLEKQQQQQQQQQQHPRVQQLLQGGGGDVSNISISRYFFASPHLGASSRVADIHSAKNLNILALNSHNDNNNNNNNVTAQQQQSTASFMMLPDANNRKLTNSANIQASQCGFDQQGCGICGRAATAEKSELIELSPKCKHLFCLPCVTLFLENKITSNEVVRIRCPRQGCRAVIHTSAFKHLIPHTLLNRYKQHRKIILQRQNPNIRYCTRAGCDGFMIGSPEHPKLICPKCGQAVCYNCCNNYHSGQRCDQAIEEDAVKELAENNRQVCPRCSHKQPLMIVDSTSESNRCVCEKCNYVFCNLCLRECGRFHFAPWNLCGCPGRKYGDGEQGVISKLCVFLWGVMKLLMYFLGWVLAVVLYPLGVCLISLFMPLVLYAYFKGQRLQYSGWKKYLLLIGLFLLGIVLYPLWVIISIVPGTCIFFKDLYQNKKQDVERSTFVY